MQFVETFSNSVVNNGLSDYLVNQGFKKGSVSTTGKYMVVEEGTFYTVDTKPFGKQINLEEAFSLEHEDKHLITPNFTVDKLNNGYYDVRWEDEDKTMSRANLEELIEFFNEGFEFTSYDIEELKIGCALITKEDISLLKAFLN